MSSQYEAPRETDYVPPPSYALQEYRETICEAVRRAAEECGIEHVMAVRLAEKTIRNL